MEQAYKYSFLSSGSQLRGPTIWSLPVPSINFSYTPFQMPENYIDIFETNLITENHGEIIRYLIKTIIAKRYLRPLLYHNHLAGVNDKESIYDNNFHIGPEYIRQFAQRRRIKEYRVSEEYLNEIIEMDKLTLKIPEMLKWDKNLSRDELVMKIKEYQECDD